MYVHHENFDEQALYFIPPLSLETKRDLDGTLFGYESNTLQMDVFASLSKFIGNPKEGILAVCDNDEIVN